ncbi:hypothetical protein NIES593_22720 [Hydrococcus rivularis NIES-593]|uniref:Uncharacterized protein n=2 Tax=Cyanophyceae TaxID=3028117 RepID=A0A1U7H726_9CYAN|nr:MULTISPECIES: hypothetical protein [Cyanophyceae]OKH10814.1 hypothetical protein NIES592_23845 [Fischerella major NIES-592]OKH17836.1 hypothetical protein NIES593_22720 [Hydrococcus rivularis NIES-593]
MIATRKHFGAAIDKLSPIVIQTELDFTRGHKEQPDLDKTPSKKSQNLSQQDEPRSQTALVSICPSCKSQTIKLDDGCGVCGWLPENLLGDKINQQQEISPSKTRRRKGEGSGSIHWKTCKRKDKSTGLIIAEYLQPWYHYEIWREGDRLKKGTVYISEKLLGKVEKLEKQKAPVREILKLLGVAI